MSCQLKISLLVSPFLLCTGSFFGWDVGLRPVGERERDSGESVMLCLE